MLSGYAKSGMTNPARKLFDKMPKREVVSWNTMVIGQGKAGFLVKV
jgi:pentatricopeptide repeat protein